MQSLFEGEIDVNDELPRNTGPLQTHNQNQSDGDRPVTFQTIMEPYKVCVCETAHHLQS